MCLNIQQYDKIKRRSSRNHPQIDPRLADAIARGELVRRQLATAEGGSISTAQAARLLGLSKSTVLRRWHRYRLIAWKHGRSVRIPAWQFAGHKMLRGIEDVLQIFASDDQWRVMRYFLATRHSLIGRRPLDMLREGKTEEAVAHTKVYAAENTW